MRSFRSAELAFGFSSLLLRKSCRCAASIPPDPGLRLQHAESWPHDRRTAEIRGSPVTMARTARNPPPPEVALARANSGQARRAVRYAAIPINRPLTAERTRRTSFVQAEGLVKRGAAPVPRQCPATAAAPRAVAGML